MTYLAKIYRMGEKAHVAQLEKFCRVCGHKVQKAQGGMEGGREGGREEGRVKASDNRNVASVMTQTQ